MISVETLELVFIFGGGFVAFLIGIWWKIESAQNYKIDKLFSRTDSHYMDIRDRLDVIWRELNTRNGRSG